MKKLIAVDLDGTLLDSENTIRPKTKKALKKLVSIGHKLAIITGRDFFGSFHVAKSLGLDKLGGLLASSNGANVYDFSSKKTIINHAIKPSLARKMIDFSKDLGFDYIIYDDNKIKAENHDAYCLDFLSSKNKLDIEIVANLKDKINSPLNKILFSAKPEIISKNMGKFNEKFSDFVNPINSMPQFLDIMPKGINKGASLVEVSNYYKINIEDTIAFGDEINDIEMIKIAGVGVSMANGSCILKKEADFICPSNDDEGIAYYLEKYLFCKED